MSSPFHSDQQREDLRISARELSGCGASPPEIAKALRISQAEVLRFLRSNKPLPAQQTLFSSDHKELL
jgi:predicted transcriptional regulator